jgi:DNA gyrase subunit A
MYRCVVDNIPDGTNTTKGVPINNLVKLEPNEKVIAVTSLHRQKLPQFAIFITKNGLIKKSFLTEYLGAKKNAGIAALKLKEGDSVAKVSFQDDEDIILITKNGMSIKFSTKEIGAIGRAAMGVVGIKLNEGDEVITALPIHKDTDMVGLFTSDGMGKKVSLNEFPLQGRGGKGTICYKLNPGVSIAGAAMLSDEDNILISGSKTSICISAKDVSSQGKAALGTIIIKNNLVKSITKFK